MLKLLKTKMIPNFPIFTRLDLSHKELVDNFFSKFNPYSEFGYANMFVWDSLKPVMISLLNDNLIIQFVDIKTQRYYLTLIGENRLENTAAQLLDYAMSKGHDPVLHTIPEHIAVKLAQSNQFLVTEDIDSNDYVISIGLIADLKGRYFEDKRHKVNRFNKLYGHKSIFRRLDLNNPKDIESVKSIVNDWLPNRPNESPHDLVVELTAIMKAIKNHHDLKLEAYGVEVDGKLEAFNIIEKVHNKTVIGHFEKANSNISGIYEYTNHNLCRVLREEGFEDLNICQDLGHDGLRKAKLAYRPHNFYRKYSVART